MSAKDLLLADLEHFADALMKNEEIGERRFNFFLTLVTSVIAGLVVLHTADSEKLKVKAELLPDIVRAALFLLFVFGVFTYLRLLQRNRVTDRFKLTLDYIRERLVSELGMRADYKVPVKPGDGLWRYFKGGLAETVGAMNAILLYALMTYSGMDLGPSAIALIAVLVVSWVLANQRVE